MSDGIGGPRRRLVLVAVSCLLTALVIELAVPAWLHSPTWNEPYHLMAGYRYWQCGDFGINSEHPPLVKWLAAVPAFALGVRAPQAAEKSSKFEANVAGRKFLYANDPERLLFRARLATGILTLLLAGLIVESTRLMFGVGPALLALLLFVLEPNILAHGALVTTDMALTCCLFAAVYAFYRYAGQPSRLRLVQCGGSLGLALVSKHSGILALPIVGLLAAVEIGIEYRRRRRSGALVTTRLGALARHALGLLFALAVMTGVAVAMLWASYGFRFRARPQGLVMTPPLENFAFELKNSAERRAILALDRSRALPEAYLYGLTDVLITSAGPRPTFLFNKLYPHARWFYFPAAFVIKSTLGFLLLLFASISSGALFRPEKRRETLFLAIPALVYFGFSMTSGLNIGVRHVLPVYPYLIVLAAAGAWVLGKERRAWAFLVGLLLLLHGASSWRSFPNYLAYSNELWGGTANTHRLLTDSNVDWGQSLRSAKRYLDQHGIRECWMAYFGSADAGRYQIPCKLLPDPYSLWWGKPVDVAPQLFSGKVLISATEVAGTYWGPGELNPYDQFRRTPPIDQIDGSILVFQGRFDLTTASALSHAERAWQLADGHQLDQALGEARTAVTLAPRVVQTQRMLGEMLAQSKQTDAARRAYETALSLAQTIHPEYQRFWIPYLRNRLAQP